MSVYQFNYPASSSFHLNALRYLVIFCIRKESSVTFFRNHKCEMNKPLLHNELTMFWWCWWLLEPLSTFKWWQIIVRHVYLFDSPLSMGSPDMNPGMSSHSLLQEFLPTQESNSGLLRCRQIFTIWATRRALWFLVIFYYFFWVHMNLTKTKVWKISALKIT